MFNLTISDLNLYSKCPRLKLYYDKTERDKDDILAPLERALENMFNYLFVHMAKFGEYPTQKEIDSIWSKKLAIFGATDDEAANSWIMLRRFWALDLPTYKLAFASLPIRHVVSNIVLTSYIPAVCQKEEDMTLVYFKPFQRTYYANDLHIRFGLLKAFMKYDIGTATIFNITTDSFNLTKSHLHIDSTKEHKAFKKTLEDMMKAAAKGPFHPRLRCDDRKCPHWKNCVIGDEI